MPIIFKALERCVAVIVQILFSGKLNTMLLAIHQVGHRHRWVASWLVIGLVAGSTAATPPALSLPAATSTAGYVCRLLINEVPFPGERGYRSEADTKLTMEALLYVLDGRLRRVPKPYKQSQVAATTARDIIDVITAGGMHGQFDGFYRDAKGRPVMVSRVSERIDNLVRIAGQGQPGKFGRLLKYAAALATAYVDDKLTCADPHAPVKAVYGVPATGSAYGWMTDERRFNPGGNFLRIPDDQQGALGGNRFFTLRKDPQ